MVDADGFNGEIVFSHTLGFSKLPSLSSQNVAEMLHLYDGQRKRQSALRYVKLKINCAQETQTIFGYDRKCCSIGVHWIVALPQDQFAIRFQFTT